MVEGETTPKILQFVSVKYGVSERTAFNYIKRAHGEFERVASDTVRDREIGLAISRLNRIYSIAIKKKNLKWALGAQQEINALLGLYAPKQTRLEANLTHGSFEINIIPEIEEDLRREA